MRGEQAIFNLEIKKKSGSSINPDIHHSKVPSSDLIRKKRTHLWEIKDYHLKFFLWSANI